ncbi:MAG: hypothetical protein ACTHQ3_09080 [Motilibacteraceae bacterium]
MEDAGKRILAGYSKGSARPDWSLSEETDRLFAVCMTQCPDAGVVPAIEDLDGVLKGTSRITWVRKGVVSAGPQATKYRGSLQLLETSSPERYVLAEHVPGSNTTEIVQVGPAGRSSLDVPGRAVDLITSPDGSHALARTGPTREDPGSLVWLRPHLAIVRGKQASDLAAICVANDGSGLLLRSEEIDSFSYGANPVSAESTLFRREQAVNQCLLSGQLLVLGSTTSDGGKIGGKFEIEYRGQVASKFDLPGLSTLSESSDGELGCASSDNGGGACWNGCGQIVLRLEAGDGLRAVRGDLVVFLGSTGVPAWERVSSPSPACTG